MKFRIVFLLTLMIVFASIKVWAAPPPVPPTFTSNFSGISKSMTDMSDIISISNSAQINRNNAQVAPGDNLRILLTITCTTADVADYLPAPQLNGVINFNDRIQMLLMLSGLKNPVIIDFPSTLIADDEYQSNILQSSAVAADINFKPSADNWPLSYSFVGAAGGNAAIPPPMNLSDTVQDEITAVSFPPSKKSITITYDPPAYGTITPSLGYVYPPSAYTNYVTTLNAARHTIIAEISGITAPTISADGSYDPLSLGMVQGICFQNVTWTRNFNGGGPNVYQRHVDNYKPSGGVNSGQTVPSCIEGIVHYIYRPDYILEIEANLEGAPGPLNAPYPPQINPVWSGNQYTGCEPPNRRH